MSRKGDNFDEYQDLYSEDVQIGEQFKVEAQIESIEVAIESWITEKGKCLHSKLNFMQNFSSTPC